MINCDDHLPNPSNFPSFPNYNGFLIEPAANVFKIPFEFQMLKFICQFHSHTSLQLAEKLHSDKRILQYSKL